MSTTPQKARKAIFAHVAARWAAKAPAIVGGGAVPALRFQGDEQGALPGAANFWAQCSTQLATTRQTAHIMSDDPGGSPAEYTTDGVVFIQVFAPMKGGYARGELLAELGQGMFMQAEITGGIWFRNPRINELPDDGTWYRWNVVADYQFNQIKGTA